MPLRQSLSNRSKPRTFPLSKDSRNWPDPIEPPTVSRAEEGQPMQTTPMWKTSVAIVLSNSLIALILASCFYKPEVWHYEVVRPLDNRFQSTLEPGDTVRIVTKDGRNLKLKIKSISSEAMTGRAFWAIGERQRVLFSDIARLEKRVRESTTPITVIPHLIIY